MSRLARAGLLVLFLAASAGLVWHLAYRAPARPAKVPIDRLNAAVTLEWSSGGTATVRAESSEDAWTGLGYAHGMNRAWPALLWRQTALGRLARWFGDDLVSLDAHTRRLGLAHGARKAYDQLSAQARSRLDAYARGMNAALRASRIRRQAEVALLELEPAPWKPWHTLAVERLFAWLGTTPFSPSAGAPPSVRAFTEKDARLRHWLHLHGFERSVAWTVPSPQTQDTTHQVLVHRIVTGASALPTVQEVTIDRPTRPPLVAATLPGSPILLSGTSGGRAWAFLPTSNAVFEKRVVDSGAVAPRHIRIETSSGREMLVTAHRAKYSLLVRDGPRSASDSTWCLSWSGLGGSSDAPTWIRLLDRAAPPPMAADSSFGLFAGDGLYVDASGTWDVLGAPRVAASVPGGVFVGRSAWTHDQAASLRALVTPPSRTSPRQWTVSDSSTWAARLLSTVLPSLSPISRSSAPPLLRDALTYLRNWDASYDRSSIGAALFEEWMRSYRAITGTLPTPADTTFFAPYRRQQAFVRAVQTLASEHGPDLRQWRWENVAPHRRYFPVWSADSLIARDLSDMATTQFAPLSRQGSGHASALAGGPSLVDPTWPAPSPGTWTGWTNPRRTSLSVRRLRFDPSAFLARPLMSGSRPPAVSLSNPPVESTTTLVPR